MDIIITYLLSRLGMRKKVVMAADFFGTKWI